MARRQSHRFSFLAHPYWAGIGVIVAIVFGVVAIMQQSEPKVVVRQRQTVLPQTSENGGDEAFAALTVPASCVARPASYPFRELIELGVMDDGTLSRNDAICQSIGWVVERDGQPVITKTASSELQYRHYQMSPGNYCAHVQCYVGDGYRRVSRYVLWTIN